MIKENRIALLRIIAAGGLFAVSILCTKNAILCYLFSALAYFTAGYDVIIQAVKKLLRGRAMDESFLMSIASLGAMALGELHEGIFVMLFYRIGELFEHIAVQRSRKSVTALLEKMPNEVMVLRDGIECACAPDAVAVGDIIVVRPGERVALDGVIFEGSATMDTSAITGESVPSTFGVGDEIVSGFVSLDGCLKIRTTKAFYDSTVYKIMEMVESAAMRRSEAENFITKFAKVYTPIVVALAASIAVLPFALSGFSNFGIWLHRALVFLVVSCPCALIISVPLGFFAGIGRASRSGILIKGSNYIEQLSRVHTIAFDKTGTLTNGQFKISNIITNAIQAQDLLALAGNMEKNSRHKIAEAIVSAAKTGDMQVEDFEELSGLGLRAVVDGKIVLCGSRTMMELQNVVHLPQRCAATCVYLSVDGVFAGRIELEDSLREDTDVLIKSLRKNGVKRICVLTGDLAENAVGIKDGLGVDNVQTGLLPQDKVELVESYLADGITCFVGDGINDAPVLARADVGIAMGALGSDVAIEAADIVLLEDSLSGVLEAVQISKRTLRTVKQNIVFAIGVKTLVLVLGALGLAGMWEAVFADVGVSVLAILNSMRLLWKLDR